MIVGTGIDVIEIRRIERVLERRRGRFEARVFTPREIAECSAHRRPAPHFALCFAAKEAAMKAVGTGWARGVRWRDIELLDTEGGVPTLSLSGAAASHARELRGTRIHVSVGRRRCCVSESGLFRRYERRRCRRLTVGALSLLGRACRVRPPAGNGGDDESGQDSGR